MDVHVCCEDEGTAVRRRGRSNCGLLHLAGGRPPAVLTGTRVAGITGYSRRRAAIPARDLCGMEKRPAVASLSAGNITCQFTGSLREKNGSDGTRTRDLRRDRPVLPLPGWAGIGGDYPREQRFSTVVLRESAGVGGRFRRPPAGSARDGVLPRLATSGMSARDARRGGISLDPMIEPVALERSSRSATPRSSR